MDALLIPVFVLFIITVPVLLPVLLLYAVPVRAAVTVGLKGGRQEQILVISWWIGGVRTSGSGDGRLTEVLIAGHTVFSHTGSMETANVESVEDLKREHTPDLPPVLTGSPQVNEIVHILQEMMGPVGAFGSAFWQQSRFEDARGTVTLGLGDPVLTGEVCGMYWASRFVLLASRIYVELEPVFDRAVLELDLTVRMKIKHPLLVLLAGLRLALHPVVREAMGIAMRRSQGASAA